MHSLLPPPVAFGLPSKFASWRPDQETALQILLDRPERFIGLTMPTGAGKSLVYVAGMQLSRGRSVALTGTNGLLDQLNKDFGQMQFIEVRGQRHYPCFALEPGGEWSGVSLGHDRSVANGPCHISAKCSLRGAGCDYWDRVKALGSGSGFTNYAWWTSRIAQEDRQPPDLLILDEAHSALDELSAAARIEISVPDLLRFKEYVPDSEVHLLQWIDWARSMYKLFQRQISEVHQQVHGLTGEMIISRKRAMAVVRSVERLAKIEAPDQWVQNHSSENLIFEPILPERYAEEFLWQGARKVVLVSATLTKKTLGLLGIKPSEAFHWECPSRFDLAHRPVYQIPTVRVDHRMTPEHLTMLVARIDQILDQRPSKGIIQTVSYRLMQTVLARSRHSDRMFAHSNKPGELAEVVKLFKASKHKNAVLISPAITTGYDFPHDECRFLIVAKLPFLDSRNPVVSARNSLDSDYGPYVTMQQFVQGVGRGVRSESDWCETFVVDDHAIWFLNKHRHLAPAWFNSAVQRRITLPKPPIAGKETSSHAAKPT